MSHQWFENFFNGLAVEFWLQAAPPPSESELTFLRQTFTGRDLLDLACGAGRYTIPLSESGYRMTGIDISAEFLAVAKRSGADVEWHEGDIRELPWRDRFDGALCFGNSFGYFDRAATRTFLRGVANALKKDAPFVLETHMTAESLLPTLQLSRSIQVGEILFQSSSYYDACESRLDTEYTFTRNDLRETKAAHFWIFTAGEIREMLTDAGFTVTGISSSPEREPFTLGSPRALYVCSTISPPKPTE